MAFSLALIASILSFAPTHTVMSMGDVHRVYIDSMNNSQEASRFRLLLSDELKYKGLVVVDDPHKSDAILSGSVSVHYDNRRSRAYATVVLRTLDGQQLWSGDFGPHFQFTLSSDGLKLRAQDIAKRLTVDQEAARRKVR